MTNPTMIDLYNNVAKLLSDAWLMPKRLQTVASPALLEVAYDAQLAIYEGVEDILTRGLMKQGVSAEAARHSAFQYVRKTVEGLAALERRARGLPDETVGAPPDQDGLTWVRVE